MTKLGIYALCKDQEDQVDGFMDCMEGVEQVLVIDLGSSDNSVLRLRNRGARVIELKMDSARADINRTAALEAMPEDITMCMCLELYQRVDHGWVEMVTNSWIRGCTRMTYWVHEEGRKFLGDWIHARHGYAWRHPIHEELIPTTPENEFHCEIHVRQGKQPVKLNLPLLKTAIEENANLGYLRMKMAQDCFFAEGDNGEISPHFEGKMAVNRALQCDDLNSGERAYTCYIGAMYAVAEGKSDEAELWLSRAVIEEHDCREWWYYLGAFLSEEGHSQRALAALTQATKIDYHPTQRHNSLPPWGPDLYIMAAKCALDCDKPHLADRFYMTGTRLFTDNVTLAQLYGDLLSQKKPTSTG